METKKKNNLFLCLRVIISIILFAILALVADPRKIGESLYSFNIYWLPVVFALIALSVLISASKWGVLLSAQNNRISLLSLFRMYVVGLFFNNFLPSSVGGDGVRILLAGKQCGRTAPVAASVVIERVLATVTLALLGLFGSMFAKNPSRIAVWLLAILVVVGIVVALVLLTGWVPRYIKNGNSKISHAWISFAESAGELKNQPKALSNSFLLSFAFQIIVAFVVAAVMRGLGLPDLSLFDLFFVSSATSVLSMVPVGINGYGLREGAYIFLLAPLGYTTSSAIAISVLFALFVSIFSLGGGLDWVLSRPSSKASFIKGGKAA